MIGGLQGDFGDLDIKYLKQNISKCRSHISGSFRRTPRHYAKWLLYSPGKRYRHCAKWLRNSPGKRYQRIRICLTKELETPSFPIRRQAPDVKYPAKVERHKGDCLRVQGAGTPPPNDTERASLSGALHPDSPNDTWHAPLSGLP